MIVALGFGNTAGDTPSVFLVEVEKCSPEWQQAIHQQLEFDRTGRTSRNLTLPEEWETLEKARVPTPTRRPVGGAVFVYYDG